MTKISELTVADLRGARDQIETHLRDALVIPISDAGRVYFRHTGLRIEFHTMIGNYDAPDRVWLCETAEWDADWAEFMATVWKRISQIPSREARELRSVMQKLGDAIEGLADSPSEFATELAARLKGLRDEAGARLITYQGAE